ncbi:MAG TPA: MCE family protein, partial [Pseudonocardia sp.]|nr:MCE family protein [Pseudonocardia sp.]
FDQLTQVLDAVAPAKLNVTLAALAGSLQGRGDELGGTLTQLNGYLVRLNPSVPALRHDFAAAAGVTQLYADVTPDLVGLLANLAVTGDTLVDSRDDLRKLLPELADAAHSGHRLFDESSDDLPHALDLLRPTTGLLADYSPGLTCFIKGLDNARKLLEPVIGGKYPDLNLNVGFLPGAPPYQPGKDLPKINAHNPPACYGLPLLNSHQVPAPYVQTDIGSHVNPYRDNHLEPGDPPLVVQLFGPQLFGQRPAGAKPGTPLPVGGR